MNIRPLSDRVLIKPAAELDGEKYLIMRQADVLAII